MSNSPRTLETIRASKIDSLVTRLIEVVLESNLSKVMSVLAEKRVHEILIPDKNRCGMITLSDTLRVSTETKPETLVTHIPVMTMETTVDEAARIMTDYKIGTVPVSDGHKITGQVTSLSILHMLRGNLPDRRISSIAKESPVTMNADDSARELLSRKRINHIPVKQRDKLVGLVTSTQCCRLASALVQSREVLKLVPVWIFQ